MKVTPLEAVVVTVGEELLSGATLDSNAAWLGRHLSLLGVRVRRRFTVGDRDDDIAEAVLDAVRGAPLVIVTGGLGPTEDDRTRPAVARALGVELIEDAALVEALRARYAATKRGPLTADLRRVCLRPRGGRVFVNPVGVAPGLGFPLDGEAGRRWVVLLPGVPREMRALGDGLAGFIRDVFGSALRPSMSRLLHTTGLPESVLAPRIEAALGDVGLRNVEVAYLPDLTGVDLRFTTYLDGADDDEARAVAILDAAEAVVDPILRGYRFSASSGDLVEPLASALARRGWVLATAESCTGGMVAERWTARPGASETFVGGAVAYADAVKEGWLGVPPEVLLRHGAVSEPVARQMAVGVCEALDADCGLGITGVAGPDGGTPEKPVGTVWIAAAVPGAAGEGRRVEAVHEVFAGDREGIRIRAVQRALHLLFGLVDDGGGR